MTKLLTAAAIALSLTTTAIAANDDADFAGGVVLGGYFSRDCEPIPGFDRMMSANIPAFAGLPPATIREAAISGANKYRNTPLPQFCDALRAVYVPLVAKYLKEFGNYPSAEKLRRP